jgi:Ca2+-binding EF-hand superfamily protein
VFDKKYESKVDAHYIGDMLRSLNIPCTNAECEKRGQTPKPGSKTITVEEFLAIYAEFFKMPEKTFGTYEDFMEGLKLYDKESNGKLSLGELSQVLVAMGKSFIKICLFFFYYYYSILILILIQFSRKITNGSTRRDLEKHRHKGR